MEENSKCQIQRTGTIILFEKDFVVIEIEGKSIKVPQEKVAPAVKPGDQVRWLGGHWE